MNISMSNLEKLLKNFPRVDVLESYSNKPLKGIHNYESTQIYLNKHKLQALWLLKNSDLIIQALSNYYEGERPSE